MHYDLITHFTGHSAPVRCVAFSPDGQYLASGSEDNKINVLKIPEFSLAQMLQGHTKPVESVSFSPDNKLLASSSQDDSVRLWRLADWTLVQKYSWKRFLGMDTFGTAMSVVFSSDGQFIFVGKRSGIEKWKIVTGVDISSVGIDKFKSNNLVAKFTPDFETEVLSIAVSSDNHFIAHGSGPYTSSKVGRSRSAGVRVKIYRFGSGLLETILTGGAYIRSLAFSPDGDVLAFTDREENIRVREINPDAHEHVGTPEEDAPPFIMPESERGTYAKSIAFSPDGQLLAAHFTSGKLLGAHLAGGNLLLWTVSNLGFIQRIKGSYTSFSFSSDSKFLASGSEDGTVSIFSRSAES